MRAVRKEMTEFRSVISDLQLSIKSCNERIDGLSERVEKLEKQRKDGALSTLVKE